MSSYAPRSTSQQTRHRSQAAQRDAYMLLHAPAAFTVCLVADVCDFLYTQGGLRFQSGHTRVSVVIDGVTRNLRVVRNGKGRSRIERGEINLSDLEDHVPEGEAIDVTVLLDGVEVPLKIDPRTAMGREGRIKSFDINSETHGLSPEQKNALARSQIKTLPYGYANEDARLRLRWAIEQGDLGVFGIEELRLVVRFLKYEDVFELSRKQPGLSAGIFEHTICGALDPELFSALPPRVKDCLYGNGNRKSIAEDPQTPASVLAVLAKDKATAVRLAVSEASRTPSSALDILAQDDQDSVRKAVAGHPNVSAASLKILAMDDYTSVRAAVAKHPRTPASVLEALAKDFESSIRHATAEHLNTSATTLEVLAGDNDSRTRVAVAANRQTPAPVLEVLVEDSAWSVRQAAAANPRMPIETLEVLAKDDDRHTVAGAASNPRMPVPILETLADNEDHFVRQGVAQNPSTPGSILKDLAKDASGDVQRAVAYHPNTPVSSLKALSRSGYWTVRLAVARHPSTPEKAVRRLLDDDDVSVREAANRRFY